MGGVGAARPVVPYSLVVSSTPPIQYKGDDLEAERGPGLGCFRFQLMVLAIAIVVTPLSVVWRWPTWLSAALLGIVILLLLVAGQTIIFLIRLVAADRRGRRRPLQSGTRTVGELEDSAADEAASAASAAPSAALPADESPERSPNDGGPVRQ